MYIHFRLGSMETNMNIRLEMQMYFILFFLHFPQRGFYDTSDALKS